MEQLGNKKILLLYTAHTLGHQRMAENIGWWLRHAGAEVVLREVLKSNPSPIVQKYLQLHAWVNRHVPMVWRFMYLWGFWLTMPLRLVAAQLGSGEIKRILLDTKPDVVITTQTSPSAVMSVLKRQGVYQGLWGIAFSDYHFHRYWVYPRSDFYITNIEEQNNRLVRLGVQQHSIFRVGMALPPSKQVDVRAVRHKLELPEGVPIVLVGSGSGTLGVSLPEGLLEVLSQVAGRVSGLRVLVLAGKNQKLYQELVSKQAEYPWLRPVPFYEPMEELYAVSALFITKPGGLTVAEALGAGVPLFVTHYLPGQEELNIHYLRSRDAVVGLHVKPQEQQIHELVQELQDGTRRAQLQVKPELIELVRPSGLSELGAFIKGLFHESNQ